MRVHENFDGSCDLFISGGQLVTPIAGDKPKRLATANYLEIIADSAVAVKNSLIVAVGSREELEKEISVKRRVIDARGKVVMPGLVDPHTHLVYGGSRAHEYEAKIKGETYKDQHGRGKGIMYTVGRTREASEDELFSRGAKILEQVWRHGTTTIEIKSGYGLDYGTEMKILRVIDRLRLYFQDRITIVATFLGAHTVPLEFKDNRENYIIVLEFMLGAIKERGLAEFADVFCDQLGFSLDESKRILGAARSSGLKLKAHIDQTGEAGGRELLCMFPLVSADHLDHLDVKLKFSADTVGVLLPGVTYHLMETQSKSFWTYKAKEFIKAGLPVALATDYNPGSCPCFSMQTVMELAARLYRLTPAQIINAATINAACALGRGHEIGSLEPGKRADIIICDTPDWREMINSFGTNKVEMVIKNGKLIRN
ncbi:imidazolonepropionase [Candidatus Falkowbacteria bacterium RIFOXYB2_FULL_47_14]|uniref:Imidazolonepropionase n=1 Tax=Candidatus Falkowbacteria bacterium RIFOXYA2_FULL_47_19 TaxID=1797994 RepID=A0A1F5SHD4_9BACT|nr:MAG: imidazolonepropionase [Candidatus Falkowbacteria bacterium RIFOXYA2_FULL_47_19]OGF34497.1 MAG: imidazolonepropionase [Candidatus Falkowbacteria bacterium RIFOXYC2_FULL_46_15]OGF43535.1 MAG: imidazolonepropionase [Candidatus Falkowbacteria bacterium RIFOXYB2_FULL_47_14]